MLNPTHEACLCLRSGEFATHAGKSSSHVLIGMWVGFALRAVPKWVRSMFPPARFGSVRGVMGFSSHSSAICVSAPFVTDLHRFKRGLCMESEFSVHDFRFPSQSVTEFRTVSTGIYPGSDFVLEVLDLGS